MISAARMYHINCLLLHAGQRVLAQVCRLPQLRHRILYPQFVCWKNLSGMLPIGRYCSTTQVL